MMCDAGNTVELVRTVVEAVRIPVTVKMRLGWDDDNLTAPFFAREFEKAGVAAVTIHGRTRAQGFGGRVNLDGIRAVVEAVERIPIIGNGDVRTIADADHMLDVHRLRRHRHRPRRAAQSVVLRPADALGRDRRPRPAGDLRQRLDFMDRHFHLLVEHRGERFACLTFRKVANWYCRVLRPGRDIQQRLMMIESVAAFERIVEEIKRDSGSARRGRSGRTPTSTSACRAGRWNTGEDFV